MCVLVDYYIVLVFLYSLYTIVTNACAATSIKNRNVTTNYTPKWTIKMRILPWITQNIVIFSCINVVSDPLTLLQLNISLDDTFPLFNLNLKTTASQLANMSLYKTIVICKYNIQNNFISPTLLKQNVFCHRKKICTKLSVNFGIFLAVCKVFKNQNRTPYHKNMISAPSMLYWSWTCISRENK